MSYSAKVYYEQRGTDVPPICNGEPVVFADDLEYSYPQSLEIVTDVLAQTADLVKYWAEQKAPAQPEWQIAWQELDIKPARSFAAPERVAKNHYGPIIKKVVDGPYLEATIEAVMREQIAGEPLGAAFRNGRAAEYADGCHEAEQAYLVTRLLRPDGYREGVYLTIVQGVVNDTIYKKNYIEARFFNALLLASEAVFD